MRIITKILAGIVLIVVSGAAINEPSANNQLYISNYENILGTSLELKISASSNHIAGEAEEAALAEIGRLNKILSSYDATSEFSSWMRSKSEPVKVSSDLFTVLSLFQQWKQRSGGALDPSAEVIGRVWKNASIQKQVPSAAALAEAVSIVKQPHYVLNSGAGTATHLDDAPLVLNSFAKSYIVNKAAEAAMAQAGVNAVVVNIGGDLVVKGNLSEPIDVSDPLANAENDNFMAKIRVGNKAVATSGNYRRGFSINGRWYSHIVDPRTGKPAGDVISATVVAPNASDAGALATAFNVLSPRESEKLAATIPGAEYLLVTKEGKQITSRGWNKLNAVASEVSVSRSAGADKVKSGSQAWDTKFELLVNLELSTIEGRVHRPFVAVWVEDADKQIVRNIALWYNKPKWIPDLTSWYRGNKDQFTASSSAISSVTGATRSAGKYSLKWDGKDDRGNYVKRGKYTVLIEAAREHGTHQLIRQELDINKKALKVNLPGNVEIASASLEYRKKSASN